MDAAVAVLIGVLITATLSGIGHIVTYKVARKGTEETTARELARAALELRVRQLNELYGPLDHLVKQSQALAGKLRETKPEPERWRLLAPIRK